MRQDNDNEYHFASVRQRVNSQQVFRNIHLIKFTHVFIEFEMMTMINTLCLSSFFALCLVWCFLLLLAYIFSTLIRGYTAYTLHILMHIMIIILIRYWRWNWYCSVLFFSPSYFVVGFFLLLLLVGISNLYFSNSNHFNMQWGSFHRNKNPTVFPYIFPPSLSLSHFHISIPPIECGSIR